MKTSTRFIDYEMKGCINARFPKIMTSGETVEKVPKQILG
jgi:hypothetical protein